MASGRPTVAFVSPASHATFWVTVALLYGTYAGSVNSTPTSRPTGAMVTFSPSTTAANGGQRTVSITIQIVQVKQRSEARLAIWKRSRSTGPRTLASAGVGCAPTAPSGAKTGCCFLYSASLCHRGFGTCSQWMRRSHQIRSAAGNLLNLSYSFQRKPATLHDGFVDPTIAKKDASG
jgi:hypothetical protein